MVIQVSTFIISLTTISRFFFVYLLNLPWFTFVNPVDGNVDVNNSSDLTAAEGGAGGGKLSGWLLLSMAVLLLLLSCID